jgi:hypothetical protein
LFEIDSVSNQLVELIQSASTSALQQANAASQVASKMAEISAHTKESSEKNRQATRSVGQLAEMAAQLRDSVSRFKVTPQGTVFNRPFANPFTAKMAASNEACRPKVSTDAGDMKLLGEINSVSGMIRNAASSLTQQRPSIRPSAKTSGSANSVLPAEIADRERQRTVEHTLELKND